MQIHILCKKVTKLQNDSRFLATYFELNYNVAAVNKKKVAFDKWQFKFCVVKLEYTKNLFSFLFIYMKETKNILKYNKNIYIGRYYQTNEMPTLVR